MRKRLISTFLSIALLSVPVSIAPSAQADDLAPCRIKASERQTLSLGFPIRDERLAKVSKPKILVVPFQLKDNPDFKFTDAMKKDYLYAEEYLSFLSGNVSTVEFVFADTIKTDFTNQTMETLKVNQHTGNQRRDESISTWGFVRKMVTDYDSQLDFSGISGVILHGSSTSSNSFIAEAMTYRKDFGDPYYRPLVTNEGQVMNAVLFDKAETSLIIAHEVLHLYGLTDLYGSASTPGKLSLMAGIELSLLTYETWILGWLSDAAVQCQPTLSDNKIQRFAIDLKKERQLFISKTVKGTILIVETSTFQKRLYLAFYSLDNEMRPPIALFTNSINGVGREGLSLVGQNAIGIELESPETSLLVSSMKNSSLTFDLIPASVKGSAEYSELKNASLLNFKAEQAAADLQTAEPTSEKLEEVKPMVKKLTITCTKGKKIIKVTSVKPKCPSGYRKK
jgi:hypothetical protein